MERRCGVNPRFAELLPRRLRPIGIIGAGGIVRDAHLPAYKLAGFQVFGITDTDVSRAHDL